MRASKLKASWCPTSKSADKVVQRGLQCSAMICLRRESRSRPQIGKDFISEILVDREHDATSTFMILLAIVGIAGSRSRGAVVKQMASQDRARLCAPNRH